MPELIKYLFSCGTDNHTLHCICRTLGSNSTFSYTGLCYLTAVEHGSHYCRFRARSFGPCEVLRDDAAKGCPSHLSHTFPAGTRQNRKLNAGQCFRHPPQLPKNGAGHLSHPIILSRDTVRQPQPVGPHMVPRALFVFALGVQLCPLTSDLELFVPTILGLSSWLRTK